MAMMSIEEVIKTQELDSMKEDLKDYMKEIYYSNNENKREIISLCRELVTLIEKHDGRDIDSVRTILLNYTERKKKRWDNG